MADGAAQRTVFAAALALSALIAPTAGADVIGRASVIDGDTLEVRGVRIRLHGIDAPESNQLCEAPVGRYRCGQIAALELDRRPAGRFHSKRCREAR